MNTEIIYDRHAKMYRMVDRAGRCLGSWPPGPQNRRAAEWAQLNIEAPLLAPLAWNLATRHPVLESRAIYATQVLADGLVSTSSDGRPGAFEVRGQTHPGETYHVDLNDSAGFPTCDCKDFMLAIEPDDDGEHPRGAPIAGSGPKCKHILAVLLALKAKAVSPAHGETAQAQLAAVRAVRAGVNVIA